MRIARSPNRSRTVAFPVWAFRLTPLTPLSARHYSSTRWARAERGDEGLRKQGAAPPPLASLGNLPSPGRSPPAVELEQLPGEGSGVGAIYDAPTAEKSLTSGSEVSSQALRSVCHPQCPPHAYGGPKDLVVSLEAFITANGILLPSESPSGRSRPESAPRRDQNRRGEKRVSRSKTSRPSARLRPLTTA